MPAPHVLFAGRTTLDALYLLDALPGEDTKVFARDFHVAPGGPACNAAITHAMLGGHATLLSAVGQGAAADFVRRELDRHAIRLTDLAAGTDYETPMTAVLANASASTRTIVNPPVAPLKIPSLGRGWPAHWEDRPELALTDGFYLEETLLLLEGLRNTGSQLCFDGGSWKPGTDALAPLLTAAICSERFAPPGFSPDAESTLAWFAKHGVPHIAVTRGPQPILCLDHGRRFEITVEQVQAVDTLGAGDVLHGAFCFHFAASGNFEESLRRANGIATRSCTGLGIGCWADPDQPGATINYR
ncbi:MAG TPA: PfkB family carbohydrate kinase [Terracidiphilus sp.]|jgi:sugar/nucleoside kinase (ribokinase family)|nr:PfkB family carbohydrate kinase [Terracidiphilus sp.]